MIFSARKEDVIVDEDTMRIVRIDVRPTQSEKKDKMQHNAPEVIKDAMMVFNEQIHESSEGERERNENSRDH